MTDSLSYELLDFGGGRRLEQFGPLVLDRPCPACEAVDRAAPQLWAAADARYELLAERASRSGVPPLARGGGTPHLRGARTLRGEPPPTWTLTRGGLDLRVEADRFRPRGAVPRAGRELGLARQPDCDLQPAARASFEAAQPVCLYGRGHVGGCRCGRRSRPRGCGAEHDGLGGETRLFPAWPRCPFAALRRTP